MAAAADTIQLEAFNVNLHGTKILCQGPWSDGKYPPILDSVKKLRDPFKRQVLVSRTPFSFSKALPLQYDATFQVKETADWSLILTYLAYAPKPALAIIEDVEVPDAVWGKLASTITCVHITATPIRNVRAYDAVFFAPIGEPGTTASTGWNAGGYAEFVFHQLQMLYKGAALIGSEHSSDRSAQPVYRSLTSAHYKEIVQELRVAGAGLAYTGGTIYWYDTVASQGSEPLSNRQLSELFTWLAGHFRG
jgi:hypothetical protein